MLCYKRINHAWMEHAQLKANYLFNLLGWKYIQRGRLLQASPLPPPPFFKTIFNRWIHLGAQFDFSWKITVGGFNRGKAKIVHKLQDILGRTWLYFTLQTKRRTWKPRLFCTYFILRSRVYSPDCRIGGGTFRCRVCAILNRLNKVCVRVGYCEYVCPALCWHTPRVGLFLVLKASG